MNRGAAFVAGVKSWKAKARSRRPAPVATDRGAVGQPARVNSGSRR
jgi:hypothetical protein